MDSNMMMIGHRGRSALYPENTRSAIASALASTHGSEFDVQRTVDGVMVILHDTTLARTAVPWSPVVIDGKSSDVGTCGLQRSAYLKLVNTPVHELHWHEINRVPVGRPHDKNGSTAEGTNDAAACGNTDTVNDEEHLLITLPEALSMLADANSQFRRECRRLRRFLVEIKDGDSQASAFCARDILASGCGADEVTVIGSCLTTMIETKRLLPAYSSVLVAHQQCEESALRAVEEAAAAGLNGVDFLADVSTVSAGVVTFAKSRGLEVLVWVWAAGLPGTDVEETWTCLRRRGVNAFTSDCPPALDTWLSA